MSKMCAMLLLFSCAIAEMYHHSLNHQESSCYEWVADCQESFNELIIS